MITADSSYTIRTGIKTLMEAAVEMNVTASFSPDDGIYRAFVNCFNSGTYVTGEIFELTKSEILAESGTGADEVEKVFSQVQKAVATKLSAFPENSSVGFTVS